MEKTDKTLVLYKLGGFGDSATFSPLSVEKTSREVLERRKPKTRTRRSAKPTVGERAPLKNFMFLTLATNCSEENDYVAAEIK